MDRVRIRENQRLYKLRNPIRCAWHDLRSNAKRRGHSCTISLEDFTEFVHGNNYMELKGREVGCMAIDRIIKEFGYAKGNLQLLEITLNSIKEIYEQQGCPEAFEWYVDLKEWQPVDIDKF